LEKFDEKKAEIIGLSVVGVSGTLTLIFSILRVAKYIGWDWKWVFGPLWIPWAVVLAFCFLLGIFVIAAGLFENLSHVVVDLLKRVGSIVKKTCK
jgi:hypothetical protein